MILLLLPSALALDWWVRDVAAADATRVALVQLWPAGPFVVRYGEPKGYGAWYADGTLHLVLPDGERTGPAGPDAAEQVVLARSWLREAPRPRTPADWRYQVGLLGGTGVTLENASAPVHVAVEGSANDRMLLLTTTVTADLAAVRPAASGTPVAEERVGVGAGAGVRAPLWGGELAISAGPTARLVTATTHRARTVTPVLGVGERLHWWRAVAAHWSFGVGASVQLDAPGASWTHPWVPVGPDRYFRPEVTTSLELGVGWSR